MNQQTNVVQMNENTEETEIDLVELFKYYRSRILVILAGFIVGAVIAGVVTFFFVTPKYEATAKLYMVSASSNSMVDLTDLNLGTSLSEDYQELLKVRPILEQVIREQKLDYKYEELLEMITIAPISGARLLTITVTSTSPAEAEVIANALAEKAESELPELMGTSKPNIAEEAIVPEYKSSPSLPKNTLIGGLVFMVLTIGVLTIFFLTDDTFKSAEDVEKVFGVMPLTVVPEGEVETISDKVEKMIQKQKKKGRKIS